MKKMFAKAVSMLCLSSLLLTACGGTTGGTNSTTGKTDSTSKAGSTTEGEATTGPEQELEKITIEWLYPLGSEYLQVVDDLNGSLVIQKISELYNIEFDFIHFASGQESEQFNIMIGTDNLPDMITHDMGIPRYPGGGDKAIADENYLRLNELIEENAPTFHSIISNDAELYKDVVTDEGNIWGMPMIDLDAQDSYVGPIIRQDWLDDLNLEAPTTIEEWYDVLHAFKAEKGAEAPFLINAQGLHSDNAFIGAYGVNAGLYQVDGKIQYGPIQDAYKDYLTEMKKWYDEGLLDPNFASNADHMAMFTTGRSGAGTQGFWVFESWEAASDDENMSIVGLPYPSLEKGGEVHFRQNNSRMRGYHTSVTTVAENPERIVSMLDYLYTDEGFMLSNYGVEGDTYTIEDGKPVYTDKMVKNEEGVPMNIAFVKYAFSHGSFLRDWHREDALFSPVSIEACKIWQDSADADYMLPTGMSLTAKEGDDYAKLMSDIETYTNEKRMEFILGTTSLDEFDAYVDQIISMGLEDAIAIQQAALDRYLAK